MSYERFYRISNGTTMMTLTDLMFWAGKIPEFAEFVHDTVAKITLAQQTEAPDTTTTAELEAEPLTVG
jgi:hypothetical protein